MLSADMVQQANSGHPGMPVGAADVAFVLWTRHLRFDPDDPRSSLIRVKTVIGFGSPKKAGTSGVHGAPAGEEELKATKEALGWPLEREAPADLPG